MFRETLDIVRMSFMPLIHRFTYLGCESLLGFCVLTSVNQENGTNKPGRHAQT
jgi:hypothetical protein